MAYNNPSFQILPPKAPSTAASVMKILDETMQRRKAEEERNAAASAKIFLENSKGRYGDDYTSEYEKWAADPQNSRAVQNYGSGMATAPVESAQEMYTRTRAENLSGADKVLQDPNASLDAWIGAYRRAYGANPPPEVIKNEAVHRVDKDNTVVWEALMTQYGLRPNANVMAKIKSNEAMKALEIASREGIAKANLADRSARGWAAIENSRERTSIAQMEYERKKEGMLRQLPRQTQMEAAAIFKLLEQDQLAINEQMDELNIGQSPEAQKHLDYYVGQKQMHKQQLEKIFESGYSMFSMGPGY